MEFLDGFFSCCSPSVGLRTALRSVGGCVCFHDTAWKILGHRNGLTTEKRRKSMSEVGCIRKAPN